MPAALAGFGAAVAVWRLACVAQVFHLAPSRGRTFFMGLATVLLFVGPGLAKLLAGGVLALTPPAWRWQVMGMSLDVYQAMFAAAGVALLALIVMLHFVQDVRRQEA